jgi:hypothetical protein
LARTEQAEEDSTFLGGCWGCHQIVSENIRTNWKEQENTGKNGMKYRLEK